MSTPLLSAFYFGSVEHYALLARNERIIIDTGEHYERQSYRTRTSIIGPNGVQHLNVQIARDHGNKMPMHTVGLSYIETWPQQHLHAIRSAYGQTPWFIHYIDEIEAVLMRHHDRLVDLNLATMKLGLKWLGLGTDIVITEKYLGTNGVSAAPLPSLDLRTLFTPKRPLPPELPSIPAYPQVFTDRHGFVPRMSVIDLVCNCGPAAGRVIRP